MKVIGAGWGRTGTSSLKKALDILGFKCYHGNMSLKQEVKSEHINFFLNAIKLKEEGKINEVDFVNFFKDYDAGVDMTVAYFYKDLMKVFPESKLILTNRDFDSWYASFYRTLYKNDQKIQQQQGQCLENDLFNKMYMETTFESKFEIKEFMRKKYNDHISDVVNTVPTDNLLLFDLDNGWKPLCQFLNKDLPNETFPDENDYQQMEDFIKMNHSVNYSAKI